jgi:hypothetical protein
LPWYLTYPHSIILDQRSDVQLHHPTQNDAASTIKALVVDQPATWFESGSVSGTSRSQGRRQEHLLVFVTDALLGPAHGFLTARILTPVFEANGIYPLFVFWETMLGSIIERGLPNPATPEISAPDNQHRMLARQMFAGRDLRIEYGARRGTAYSTWQQFKSDAGGTPGRLDSALALVAKSLSDVYVARERKLQLHLVGHGAGAIWLAHLMGLLQLPVASCTLLAPACTVALGLEAFGSSEQGEMRARQFHLHVLSPGVDSRQTFGPYGGSILALISRALEYDHRTPLLGMSQTLDSTANDYWHPSAIPSLRAWQYLTKPGKQNDKWLSIERRRHASAGAAPEAGQVVVSSESLDRNAEVIDALVRRVLGRKTIKPAWNLQP